ncbi:MAG: hypothetical protein MI757_23370 [Pirellulales bacterium]|nr:hypothetical protein [Pirellulales bacterium]
MANVSGKKASGNRRQPRIRGGNCPAAGVRVTTVIPSWGAPEFTDAAGMGPRDPQTADLCIQPTELGDQIALLCNMPKHLAVQDITIWPMVQELTSL